MSILTIKGGQRLSGSVSMSGSKNAALPIIAASLFFRRVTLHNVPRIGDVITFLSILDTLGVWYEFEGNTLQIDTSGMSLQNFDGSLVKKIRASILLLPALLHRFGRVNIPYPGGCNLGKRSIDDHIEAFRSIGFEYTINDTSISFFGSEEDGDKEIFANFSVTATENIVMASILRPGKTTIRLAAIEPHVMNLIDFLRSSGANIAVGYDHTLEITGVDMIASEKEHTVISDYLEAGTFVVLGALAARDFIDIRHVRSGDLQSFLHKVAEAGVRFEWQERDTLRVYYSPNLRPVCVQTNVFPWFPTDLQPQFSVLLTQAEGISKIHEILFENRLCALQEIENMRGHVALLNPHQALIFGRTPLKGATVSSWDLRAGVAMVIAGLIATGETHITNVSYIERGYEDIIGKIRGLGADIIITQ